MTGDNQKQEFIEAVLENISALNRFAYSLCQDTNNSEELVSETIVKAFEKYADLNDKGKLKQWLFRILRNQFISNYRKKKAVVVLGELQTAHDNDFDSFSLYDAVRTTDWTENGNVEKEFISKITRQQVQFAISQLPVEFRISLSLCDIDGFSYAEISRILNIPIGTVRSRIARARAILQKKLWSFAKDIGINTSATKKRGDSHVCTCEKSET